MCCMVCHQPAITSIACGSFHTLALTENGDVLSWGCGYYGQLGLGNNK